MKPTKTKNIKKRRFSNYYVDSNYIIHNDDGSIYTGDSGSSVSTQSESGLGQNSSGSGAFNWTLFGEIFSNLTNQTASVLTSIYGRNNIQAANYNQSLYENEKRTNTILWVVIGLVVALGVFLVVRKTK